MSRIQIGERLGGGASWWGPGEGAREGKSASQFTICERGGRRIRRRKNIRTGKNQARLSINKANEED